MHLISEDKNTSEGLFGNDKPERRYVRKAESHWKRESKGLSKNNKPERREESADTK